MKINKCGPSFGTLRIKPNALNAMSKRMPAGQFCEVSDRIVNMYEKSPFGILFYTKSDKRRALNAIVTFENDILIQKEEPIIESFFKNPCKFIESVCDEIDYQEVLLFGKRSRGIH